jgi:hypothetical protein
MMMVILMRSDTFLSEEVLSFNSENFPYMYA